MMKPLQYAAIGFFALAFSSAALAQAPPTPTQDQAAELVSADPQLAANKKLVYDFWREVFEGGHMNLAEKYLAEDFIQHNPSVASGRAAFVAFFSKIRPVKPIAPTISSPLISITAERDLVTLSFVREYPDPKDPAKKYATSWFDMFRVKNGKIVEHWDPAQRAHKPPAL